MAVFGLAKELGMTVSQLMDEMPRAEFDGWMWYFKRTNAEHEEERKRMKQRHG